MKRMINKAVGPVCALGAGLAAASCLWLVLHAIGHPDDARRLMLLLLGAALVQLAAWVGVRFFPRHHIWPGVCMLASVPLCMWCGIAGPGTLLGISYGVIPEMLDGYAFDILVYTALPGMIVAILGALAFALVGMAWLVVDVQGMVLGEAYEPEPKHKRADRYLAPGREQAAQPPAGHVSAPAPAPAAAGPIEAAISTEATAVYRLEPFDGIGRAASSAGAQHGTPQAPRRGPSSLRGTPAAGQRPAPPAAAPRPAREKKPRANPFKGLGEKLLGKKAEDHPPAGRPPAPPPAQAAPLPTRPAPPAGPAQPPPPAHRPLAPNPYAEPPSGQP